MDCPICKDPIKTTGRTRVAHLVIEKTLDDSGNGHVHTHGDIVKTEHTKEMLELAGEECGVAFGKQNQLIDLKEVVFHNRQRIGDMLMFTCAIRDFKAAFPHVRVNIVSTARHIWDYNPHIDPTLKETPENMIKIGPTAGTNQSNRIDWHFSNAFRISIEQALNVHIPQGESRPDIYLTQEEYDAPRVFEKPYWIICITGEKGWGCKMYPFTKWQKFVDQNPDKIFVQIGAREDNPPRLQGAHVIDYVGKTQDKNTGIRDLFKLFLNAEGSIGLVSFHMHLSGALQKPCLVVAGAREPVHFTRYPGHAYLATDGMLPCAVKACWHCDIHACTNPTYHKNQNGDDEIVPKCVEMIDPEDLTRAINGYYLGGRLQKDVPSAKPKFKNIVPTPQPIKKELVVNYPAREFNMHGMKWGGSCILEEDWIFMQEIIAKHNVRNVLEFGSGLSTILFEQLGVKIVSYETSTSYANNVRTILPGIDVRMWDGKTIIGDIDNPPPAQFDLVFVDGPAGPENREDAIRLAAKFGKMVIIHDGWCAPEKAFMAQYLDPVFKDHVKGGRRCHFYSSRKDASNLSVNAPIIDLPLEMEEESFKKVIVQPAQNPQGKVAIQAKHVKIVSTARGWGGQARSITTIMRLLLKAGHRVEFIPFRNAVTSSEMKAILKGELSNVTVTENYDTIKERCDVLFMYADDYIWEFGKPEIAEAFSGIGAERKIMMLNYRRGNVGEIEWTQAWDKYMFLNSFQENELLKKQPLARTKVLPPCTDLEPFFAVKPDYEGALRLVRHSSQGDTKFSKGFGDELVSMRSQQKCEVHLLPGPSFIEPNNWIFKYPRTSDPHKIAEFLGRGNCFWYSLPEGYMDMGPRVILEAMAAGLPVIADNWGGAVDRVTPETGWLFDEKIQHVEILPHLTPKVLKEKGEAARERARQEFVPDRWIREILE